MSTVEEDIKAIPVERREAVEYAANLETIRINRWRLYETWKRKIGSLDTTSQDLDTGRLSPGWIYVITNITALEEGTKPTLVQIGYVRTGHFIRLTSQTPSNNNDSVDYVGQVILHEGDIIRARFKGATASDTIYLYVNGYKIRR